MSHLFNALTYIFAAAPIAVAVAYMLYNGGRGRIE